MDALAHLIRLVRFANIDAIADALKGADPQADAAAILTQKGYSPALASWLSILRFKAGQASVVVDLAKVALEKERDSVRLAWTLPDTLDLAPPELSTEAAVGELISTARDEIIIAGYQISEAVIRRYGLHRRAPGLRVIAICDACVTQARDLVDLRKLGVQAVTVRNKASFAAKFHIKAIVSDRKTALVTSANFTDLGQSENIELGVVLTGIVVEELAERLLRIVAVDASPCRPNRSSHDGSELREPLLQD